MAPESIRLTPLGFTITMAREPSRLTPLACPLIVCCHILGVHGVAVLVPRQGEVGGSGMEVGHGLVAGRVDSMVQVVRDLPACGAWVEPGVVQALGRVLSRTRE